MRVSAGHDNRVSNVPGSELNSEAKNVRTGCWCINGDAVVGYSRCPQRSLPSLLPLSNPFFYRGHSPSQYQDGHKTNASAENLPVWFNQACSVKGLTCVGI